MIFPMLDKRKAVDYYCRFFAISVTLKIAKELQECCKRADRFRDR